jgi:hypothetical protein
MGEPFQNQFEFFKQKFPGEEACICVQFGEFSAQCSQVTQLARLAASNSSPQNIESALAAWHSSRHSVLRQDWCATLALFIGKCYKQTCVYEDYRTKRFACLVPSG